MAEKGVKVKIDIQIDEKKVNTDVKNAVEDAVKDATIKLSNFQISIKGLNDAIKKATEKVPVRFTNVSITKAGLEAIASQMKKMLAEHPMSLEIASIDAKPAIDRLRKQLTTMLSGLQIGGLKEFLGDTASSSALEQAAAAEEKMAEALEKVRERAVNANVALKQLSALSDILGGTKRSILNLEDADKQADFTTTYDELIHQVQRYRELIKETGNAESAEMQEAIASIEQKVVSLKKSVAAQKEAESAAHRAAVANQENIASAKSVADTQARIGEWVRNNADGYARHTADIDEFNRRLEHGSELTKAELKEIESEFSAIVAIENIAISSTKTLFDHMSSAWSVLMQFGIVSNFGMQFANTIKQMVSNVRELDTAMTELKKVTDLSAQAYVNFQSKAAAIAKNVGASVSDTINATADFARLGFNIDEAAQLAEAALVYKNVGDGITDISVATESLISTIKAFGIEASDAMYIVDMFNEVGNNFAISSVGIGDALQRSAAALSTAGNTIQESIGLVTAMNSVVQDPDAVGTAMKTLTMYLRAAKTDAEAAGIETDGMAESVSKLRNELKGLTGVDIMIDDTQFKSTYEIIKAISEKWAELNDVTRANVLNLLGGKRNANVISSLLSNFETAEAAMTDAMNALGSAAKENEAYLDSIEGKIAKFNATFQELSALVVNSSIVKFVVDVGTALMNMALFLEKIGALLPIVVAGFVAFKGVKAASDATHILTKIITLANSGRDSAQIISAIADSFAKLSGVGQTVLGKLLGSYTNQSTVIGDVATKLGSVTAAQAGAAGTSKMLATATAGVSTAFSAFGAALTGVTAIISGAIVLYNLHNQAVQASIDKANEIISTYSDSTKTYRDNISTLDGLKSRFYELSRSVGENGTQGKLTADEYKEYKNIVQQIIDISPAVIKGYDKEGKAIIDYTKLIQNARLEQEKLAEVKLSEYINNGQSLFSGKQTEFRETEIAIGKIGEKLEKALSPDIGSELADELAGNTNAKIAAIHDAMNLLGRQWTRGSWNRDYRTLETIYDRQNEFVLSLRSSGAYTEDEIRNIQSLIGSMSVARNKLADIRSDELEYITTRLKWESEQAGKSGGEDWFGDIPLAALSELENSLLGVISPLATMNDNMAKARALAMDFASAFADTSATMEDGTTVTYAYIKSLIDAFDAKGSHPEEKLAEITEAVDAFLDSIEDPELRTVMEGVFASMIPSLNNASDGTERLLGEYHKLSDGIKQVKSDLDILNKAQKEMETGGISADTLQSILGAMGDGESVSDYLTVENGVLKLNIEAWNNRTAAITSGDIATMRSNLAMLQAQNDEIDRGDDLLLARNLEITNRIEDLESGMESGRYNIDYASAEIEKLTAELYSNIAVLNAHYDIYRNNDAQIKQLTSDIEIYEAAYASLTETVEDTDFELDFSETNSAISQTKDNLLKLAEIRDSLQDGNALTADNKDWITSLFPDVDIWSADAEDQLEIVTGLIENVQGEWQDLIDEAITFYEAKSTEAASLFGVDSDTVKSIEGFIGTLRTLRDINIEDTWGDVDAEDTVKPIEDIVSKLKNAQSLISTIEDEIAESGTNSIETLMSFIKAYGDGWENEVEISPDKILIATDAYEMMIEAEIRAAIEDENLANQMIASIRVTKEKADANKQLADSYKNVSSAIKNSPGVNDNTELTYSAYQDMIAIDARYSSAVEYQNGVLSLNRDRYEAVTNAIMRETLAQAQANMQAIIASDEYKDLNNRIGSLNSEEQKRLDSLNAEITGYAVLASELANATSAYQRFLRASDSADADTFSAAEKAMQVIKDTLYNSDSDIFGMKGREQYIAAMDFLIDPNIDTNSAEFEAAFAKIEQYLQKGGVGVQAFVDDLFASGLVDPTGHIAADLDTVAGELGITVDFLRAMIDQYNQYADKNNKLKVDFDDGGMTEETKTATEQLAALQEQVTSFNTSIDVDHDVSITTTTAETNLGNVSSALSNCINKLNALNGKSVTTYVRTVYTKVGNDGGVAGMSGFANARGTDGAPGGRTLVGEVGMETVVDPNTNRWYTVGANGAEFVNLPKGAVVFDAQQTRELFAAGRTRSRGNAMMSGNANMNSPEPDIGGSVAKGGFFSKIKDTVAGVFQNIKTGVTNVKETLQGILQQQIPTTPQKPTGGGGSSGPKPPSLDELQEQYEEIAAMLDHLIEHQKILYDEAERGLNYQGMASSLSEQAKIYQQKMEKLQEGIDKMKAAGAEDTDEQLQKLEEAKWDAERSMFDVIDQLNALYVDAVNNKIDGIQDAYNKLSNAANEFNQYGGITVDTFQSLLENGVQYLSLLDNVNGQYVINEEGINRMIAAQKEQLAIEQALSYLNQVKEALMSGNTNALANLANMTETISESTWGTVDAMLAQLKTLGLSDEMYASISGNIEALHSISDAVITDVTAGTEDQGDNIDYILKKTKELIKYETNQHIKAIQDEVKAYKDIVQAKKDSLKASKDEDDYQKSVAEKTKEIAELQARIDQLALDDSREARAERAALMKELAEKQGDLGDLQSDHAYDATVEALDAEAEAYEQSRQQEIDELQASINSEEQLYQAAIQRISTGWDTLYQDLITWNTEAGNVLNSEITENWNAAAAAASQYGSYIGALQHYGAGGFTDGSSDDGHNVVVATQRPVARGAVSNNAIAKNGIAAPEEQFLASIAEKVGNEIDVAKLTSQYEASIASLEKMQGQLANENVSKNDSLVFNPVINVTVDGATSEAQARAIGKSVAESALDALYEAFERKGMSSTIGRQLKQ